MIFGGGIGPTEEREFGEYFFNQINYCWETSHFSPFNLYSMGNPSNTPAQSVRQDWQRCCIKPGREAKDGMECRERTNTGRKGLWKSLRRRGKAKGCVCNSSDKGGWEKMGFSASKLRWDGMGWDGSEP